MKDIVGYFGCAAISIVMMGVVFQALVWPTLKCRKKSVLGWVVSVVFGFGMLHSMAVKPGGGDALQGPRRSPPQQTAEPTNAVEIVTTTNTPPWETTLAFSHIETTPSNVQLTVAWPMGFYNYDPLLDLFITYPTLTNDWQWIECRTASPTDTNCVFTVTPSALGLTELPPALFARVTERTEACEAMDDPDGDGIPDPDELIAGTDPLDALSFLHGVVIEVTNTTAVAGSQVYVSWERVGDCPVSGFLTNSAARSFFTSFSIPHTNGEILVTCFRDLNGNATFDPDHDIALAQSIPDRSEYTRLKFTFGDVDHDGINDEDERIDGTDPYSSLSLKINRRVCVSNKDEFNLITNYVTVSALNHWNDEDKFRTWTSTEITVLVSTNASSGYAYIKCYRDLNRNGYYDEEIDPLYVFNVPNDPEGKDFTASIFDFDSDSIHDSIELLEGANPLNSRSYCYMPTLFVEGVFTTTNNLLAQAYFGTNTVTSPHVVTNDNDSYCFGHLVTTNSEIASIMYWDDINGNNALDDGEPFSTSYCTPRGHITVTTNNLAYSHFDSDSNLLPDWWESISGLKDEGEPVKWYNDDDYDGLINLHEYWCGTDPLTPDGSNTVLSILSRSIDDRIATLKDNNVFLNYKAPPFERNTNCWAYGIDLTCASPYNSALRTNMAGTAISPQHIIIASHYPYGSNTVVRFCDSQSSDIRRTVIARQTIPNTDISICLLDDPLPDTIEPARILPPDYASYIGNGRGLPLLELDQEEHAIIVDKYPITQGKGETSAYQSNDTNRLKYYESAISGDSGDPVFFIYNQTPILLYCLHTGGGGGGPFTTCYACEIQNAMDELSNSYHKPCEALQYIDFSLNDKIEREF